MTLREKIAQLLIMGFSGVELLEQSLPYRWLTELGIGGVILFDKELMTPSIPKNLQTCDQIKTLTTALQQASRRHTDALPLLIAIDYEGGQVDRLKNIPGTPTTLRPVELAQLSLNDRAASCRLMAETIQTLGFNLNFAPVVDLNLEESQGIMGAKGRCFSSDPLQVVESARVFMDACHAAGIVSCLKHFPGHGSALGDTHLDCVDVTDTFNESELIPYELLLGPHANHVMVMTAHVVNKRLDPTGVPATLSQPILNLLRARYQFDGVVVSDDLQMKAISDHIPLEDALSQTLQAGADMLIFGNQWGQHDAFELVALIEKLVHNGRVSVSRIEQAYQRVINLKSYMVSEKQNVF